MTHKILMDMVITEIEPSKTYKSFNDDYRMNKMNKYIKKRSLLLDHIINSHSSIPTTTLIEWYDIFYEYSTMGFIDESTYWMIMRRLKNPFAKFNTSIHSILFDIYSTYLKHKIEITEFLLSLLLFNDESDYFIKLRDLIIKQALDTLIKLPCLYIMNDIKFYIQTETKITKITTEYLYHIHSNLIKNPNEYSLIMEYFIRLNKLTS